MMIVFYILFFLLLLYTLAIVWLGIGFLQTKTFEVNSPPEEEIPVSIIICARNEEKTIARCLKSILAQHYSKDKMQVILINDASSDSTVFQAEAILKNSAIAYKLISNRQQKGKKQSISFAMQFTAHELIVLRDADTYTYSDVWLKTMCCFYTEKKSDLIIGPVAISDNSGSLWAIQTIENNVLTVLNCGSAHYKKPFLCNGANLAFTRSIFEKVNGYNSHINVASGDDILFLEDVKKVPGAHIDFLKNKNAIVSTYPCFSFSSLMRQKIRWASKFKVNKNRLNLVLAILSFSINSGWLFCLFYGFLVPENGRLSLIFVLFKLFIDFLLLFLASRFIKNKALAPYVFPIGFIYPIYSCLVAVAAIFVKPKWK